MNVGIQVLDPFIVSSDRLLKCGLALGVLGAVTAAVASAKSTVAVDIHVDQVAVGALEVHDAVVVQVVTAVGKV